MRRGFVKQIESAKELQQIVAAFDNANVDADAIVITPDFVNIYPLLNKEDVIVVRNYASISTSGSINNFFDIINEIVDKGVQIESIEEPNVVLNKETAPIFQVVCNISYAIRRNQTLQGLAKARSAGKTLGRPAGTKIVISKILKIDELCKNNGVSVLDACRIVGCLPRTYYRLKKENQPKN